MPVTMSDVADRAGVSIRTVSRVVNDSGSIAPDTRARVLAIIDELGFRPSKLARGLVTQRTEAIGLLVPDMLNPYYTEMARAIFNQAARHGYTVLVGHVDEDPDRAIDILELFADYAVDGVILPLSYGNAQSVLEFADDCGPVVAVNAGDLQHPAIGHVYIGRRRGADLAMDHLIRDGRQAIALLASDIIPTTFPRLDGYLSALSAYGMPVDPARIVRAEPTMDGAYAATLDFLGGHPEIDAIFAYNDVLAIGALRACKVLGRAVPASCAVIGFDDTHIAEYVSPALTTVRVDKERLGVAAVDRLLEMLAHPGVAYPPIVLEPELVVRESA